MIPRLFLAMSVVLMLVLLGGCARGINSTPGDSPNLRNWVDEVRARPAPALESLPIMQQFESFDYAAQGIRDPFSDAWVNPDGDNVLRPDPNRRKEPLEGFPLDSLSMIGSIGSGSGLVALVIAPDKVTYRVRTGGYMGQSDGRVTAVDEGHIELIELVPDGAGSWLERPASIALGNQ